MPEQINSAAEVIDRLGGNTAVAKRMGVTPNAVGNWKVRGLPPETFVALNELLSAQNLSAPPSLWKMRAAT